MPEKKDRNRIEEAAEEHNYYMLANHPSEIGRLLEQSKVILDYGGMPLLPPGVPENAKILDAACGIGSWLQEVALKYKETSAIGIDIRPDLMTYAQTWTNLGHQRNVLFQQADVTKPLEFEDNSFDLVNGQLMNSFLLSRESWSSALAEMFRVTKKGGVIRLVEMNNRGFTMNGPHLEHMFDLIRDAMVRQGRIVNITPVLPTLLEHVGYRERVSTPHMIDYSQGTPAYSAMYNNFKVMLATVFDFILAENIVQKRYIAKATAPYFERKIDNKKDLERLYNDCLYDLSVEDFTGQWIFLEMVAKKPV